MAIQTVIEEIYTRQDDGSFTVQTIEHQIDVPTQEELIAQKQEELLRVYNELQLLSATQS